MRPPPLNAVLPWFPRLSVFEKGGQSNLMGKNIYPLVVPYPHSGCEKGILQRLDARSNYVCSECGFSQERSNIILCPKCETFTLWRNDNKSDYLCSSCGLVMLNEETVKKAVEDHFCQEFLTQKRTKRNDSGPDLILESKQPGLRWIIEAKGEIFDSANRLMEIQRGLGQLLQQIRDPEKQNAKVMYGLALPDTSDYWPYLENHEEWVWVRKTLQLHWLLVNKDDKSVRNIGPDKSI